MHTVTVHRMIAHVLRRMVCMSFRSVNIIVYINILRRFFTLSPVFTIPHKHPPLWTKHQEITTRRPRPHPPALPASTTEKPHPRRASAIATSGGVRHRPTWPRALGPRYPDGRGGGGSQDNRLVVDEQRNITGKSAVLDEGRLGIEREAP